MALLCACAPAAVKPQAASQPASQPGKTFIPIDPKDDTQGYFVTYDAAKSLLQREYKRDQDAKLAAVNCDERVKLVQDLQPVSAWNLWGKPTVVGVGLFILGLGAGIIGEKLSK